MSFCIGDVRLPLLLTALAVALLLFAASPPSSAAKSACKEWGKSNPAALSNGEARAAILCLVNKQRHEAGVPTLDRDKKLQKAAQKHSDRMDGSGCFSHQCPGEGSLEVRLRSVGYLAGGLVRWMLGENIGWGPRGQGTPRSVVGAWMNSPGHRANILSGAFREIGVGFAAGTPSSKRGAGGIYTADFGLAVG
jgi:uncharacterized protein YkwD